MTFDKPDKSLIRQRFARSLKTYIDNASVQQRIANRLMSELVEASGSCFNSILEIGCGSGLFTRMIQQQLCFDSLYLNDLVEDCRFLEDDIPKSKFVSGDIETIHNLPGEFELVVSNATFQWLHDFPATLEKLSGITLPGGILAFSTFGPDNVSEVSSITGTSLEYLPLYDLKEIMADNYDIITCYEKWYFLEYESPIEVLKHLKQTGVTAISNQSWTKSDMADFCDVYASKYSTENGVVLSYHPIIVVAVKKEL